MDFWKKYICILDIFEPLPCFFFQFLTRRTLMNAVEEAILCDSWMLTGPGPSPDTQLFEASWVVEISFIPFHRKGPFTSIRGNLCWVIRWCDGPAFFGFVEFCKYLQIEVISDCCLHTVSCKIVVWQTLNYLESISQSQGCHSRYRRCPTS